MGSDSFEPSTWAEVEDALLSGKPKGSSQGSLASSIRQFTTSPEKHPLITVDRSPPPLHPSLSAPQGLASIDRRDKYRALNDFIRARTLPRAHVGTGPDDGDVREDGVGNPRHFEDLLGLGRVDLETGALIRRYAKEKRGKGGVRGRGIGVKGTGGSVNPAGEEFDPEAYLARVHGGTPRADLVEGLERLRELKEETEIENTEMVDKTRMRILLAAEDFRVVMGQRESIRLNDSVDAEKDASPGDDAEGILKIYEGLWNNVLERKRRLDRLRRVRNIVRTHQELFALPKRMLSYADSVEKEDSNKDGEVPCLGILREPETTASVKSSSMRSLREVMADQAQKEEDRTLVGLLTMKSLPDLLHLYSSAELFLSCQTHASTLQPFEELLRSSMAKLVRSLEARLQRSSASKGELINILSVLLSISPENVAVKERGSKGNKSSTSQRPAGQAAPGSPSGSVVESSLNLRLAHSLQMIQMDSSAAEASFSETAGLNVSVCKYFLSAVEHYWSLASAVLLLPASRHTCKQRRNIISSHLARLLHVFNGLAPLPLPPSASQPNLKQVSQLLEATERFSKYSRKLGTDSKPQGLERFINQTQDLVKTFLKHLGKAVGSMCREIGKQERAADVEDMLEGVQRMTDRVAEEIEMKGKGIGGTSHTLNENVAESVTEVRWSLEDGFVAAAEGLMGRGESIEDKMAIVRIIGRIKDKIVQSREGECDDRTRRRSARLQYLHHKSFEDLTEVRLAKCRELVGKGLRFAEPPEKGVRGFVKDAIMLIGVEVTREYGLGDERTEGSGEKVVNNAIEIMLKVLGQSFQKALCTLPWDDMAESEIAQLWIELKCLKEVLGSGPQISGISESLDHLNEKLRTRGVQEAKRERWDVLAKEEAQRMIMVKESVEAYQARAGPSS